jgi:hypothetical protein
MPRERARSGCEFEPHGGVIRAIASAPLSGRSRSRTGFAMRRVRTREASRPDRHADGCARRNPSEGRRLKDRWLLLKRAVRPMRVVVGDIIVQHPLEVSARDDHPVETLAAGRCRPSVRRAPSRGRRNRCADHRDPFGAEDLVEAGGELAVAVADQETRPLLLLGEGHDQVARCWATQAPARAGTPASSSSLAWVAARSRGGGARSRRCSPTRACRVRRARRGCACSPSSGSRPPGAGRAAAPEPRAAAGWDADGHSSSGAERARDVSEEASPAGRGTTAGALAATPG